MLGSVSYDNDTGNYSDPGALPALNSKSDSDLDAGVDMDEAVLILCLLLKPQLERNPAAAPILFRPRPCALADRWFATPRVSINPINFLDQVEHRIDDAGRFRESGERLVAVTTSHTDNGG